MFVLLSHLNKYKLLVVFLVLSLCANSKITFATAPAPDSVITFYTQQINSDSIQAYMQALEDFGTRFCLADNRKHVAEWIRDKFISLGYTNAHLDSFQFNRWYAGVYYQTWQYNVIADLSGYRDSDSVFILGAHYDAIVPNASNPFAVAPGADDNASGVAATLEIARVMKIHNYLPAWTIRFLAFAAEELGLHGSWDYANKAHAAGMNIICIINNDMVSHCTLPEEQWKVRIQKYPNSDWFTNLAHSIIDNHTILTAIESTQYIMYSDSWPFYYNGYNAVFFIEDQFTPFYHTTGDLVATTNKYYAAEMTKISMGMLVYLNGTGTLANVLPADVVVDNLTVGDGESLCFQAFESVVVAGEGNAVIVEGNASLELYAANEILLLSGFSVEDGGYLLAKIESETIICLPASLLAEEAIGPESKMLISSPPRLLLYPNPTSGELHVNLSEIHNQDVVIEIFDMPGQLLLRRQSISQEVQRIDLSAFEAGVYFVRIIAQGSQQTSKIIKTQ